MTTAKQLEKRLAGIEKQILEGKNEIVKFNRKIVAVEKQASKATKLAAQASKLAGRLAPLLKLVGIAANIFAVIEQAATILVFSQRFEGVENYVDAHEVALSKLLSIVTGQDRRLDTLEPKVKNLNDIAAEARSNASKGLTKATALEPKVNNLNNVAAQANSNASKALTKVTALEPKVSNLNNVAAQANSNASKALQQKAIPGLAGAKGAPGTAGAPGQKGATGPAGAPGVVGAPGKQGAPGVVGAPGPQGAPGAAGAPGKQGVPGPQGVPGQRGATGVQGAPGQRGATGVQGAPGAKGEPGVAGAPGPQGQPGVAGAPGAQGEPGIAGAPGATGEPGLAGAPGATGERGPRGLIGPQGEPGKDAEDVDLSGIEAKLDEANAKAIAIAALITALPAQESFKDGVAEGTCRTTQPGGCMAKKFDGLDAGNKANGDKLDALNAGMEAIDLSMLSTINNKLGPQIPNGGIGKMLQTTSGLVGKTWDFLQIDRVLAVLNFATSLHNAYMLSSSLTQTLFSAIGNILDVFGIEDKEGNALDVSSIVSKWTDSFAKKLFGVSTVEGIKAEWKALNRVYQAASNVIWSVQSIFDSTRSLMNIAIENTGKIGNALKRSGAVFENAYGNLVERATARNLWQKRFDDFAQGVGAVESVISTIDSAASEVLSIQSTAKELVTQQKELNDSVEAFKKELDDKELSTKEVSKAPQL